MARIFITGSSDGLGQLAANALIDQGHNVILHARNATRAKVALDKVPGAEMVLTADLSIMKETISLAEKVNASGRLDTVIHNAAVYNASGKELLAVNTLAPYILTCLIKKPKRLIYLSSDMHRGGHSKLDKFQTEDNAINYSDTKLHMVMLCKAVARKWPHIYANVLNPGWVPTKMGGRGAPDDLKKGYETQVWLASSADEYARVSGHYFFHQKQTKYNREADDVQLQEKFLAACKDVTGISLA